MFKTVLVLAAGDDPNPPALERADALTRVRFAELVLGNTAERVRHQDAGDVLVVTPARA